jgi:hypothetical protein
MPALEDKPEAASGFQGLFLEAGFFFGAGDAARPVQGGFPDIPTVDICGQDDADE